MEGTQREIKRAYRGGANDVVSFTAGLRRIVRAGSAEAGLTGIDIRIKGDPAQPGVAECEVNIHGDTAENAYEIAQIYEDNGWTCVSTGETDVRCTSPD